MDLRALVGVVERRVQAVGVELRVPFRLERLPHRLLERQLVGVPVAALDPVVAVVADGDDEMARRHVGGAPGNAVAEPGL